MHTAPHAAIGLLEAAARLQPDRARIHGNLAWALSNAGRHAEAKAAAERARSLDPDDPYTASIRVTVLGAARDDSVIEAARETMQLPGASREDRRDAHAAMCWALMRTAPASAVRETERLVAEWPDHAYALAAHGCALAGACRWDEGLTWLDKAIAVNPTDLQLAIRRAKIEEARDFAHAMMRQLRANAERHPTDANGWRELGLCLAKFARLSEALEAFDRANALDPADGDARPDPLVMAALTVEATARSAILVGEIAPIG